MLVDKGLDSLVISVQDISSGRADVWSCVLPGKERHQLDEQQDRKTREVRRSLSGLQRKKQGHTCTPRYEGAEAKLTPGHLLQASLLSLDRLSAGIRAKWRNILKCQRRSWCVPHLLNRLLLTCLLQVHLSWADLQQRMVLEWSQWHFGSTWVSGQNATRLKKVNSSSSTWKPFINHLLNTDLQIVGLLSVFTVMCAWH